MKILIPTDFKLLVIGGVTSYVVNLMTHLEQSGITFCDWNNNNQYLIHNHSLRYFGKVKKIRVKLILKTLFWKHVLKKTSPDIVHLNPSLNWNAFWRDSIIATKCIKSNIPFVVFIHGWNKEYERYLETSGKLKIITNIFGKADKLWVLSSEFKKRLIEWGLPPEKIIIESTMVDDSLLEGCDIYKKLHSVEKEKKFQILFLSRVIKEKGIYEALDAYFMLREKGVPVNLTVAGDGLELPAAKEYVMSKGIKDVEFSGFVTGKEKIEEFKNADIYIFPTYHGEGMPITILEAMAFGLPVVTRPVAGIEDFFENGKHGFITESKSPKIFASLLETLIVNEALRHEIALFNYKYAQENFMASKVTKRIEAVYLDLMKS